VKDNAGEIVETCYLRTGRVAGESLERCPAVTYAVPRIRFRTSLTSTMHWAGRFGK
jgi:hypothetical protein